MLILLMLPFLFSGFNQKWYIPAGVIGECGRILINDTDRDGNFEFIFTTYGGSFTIYFYELHLPNTWEVDSFPYLNSPLLWDIGDFDLDGLWDIVFQASAGPPNMLISVAESPDSFSYPTQEVWRDTAGFALVLPISAYDVDNDGVPEILDNNGDAPNFFWIYESIGNNQYDLIFTDNPDTSNNDAPSSTHGFGDFDSDGKIEFVMGGMSAGSLGATYWIYESPADNTYERIIQGYVSTKNIKDCFSVPDADGDGKMEFVVKGFWVYGTIDAFIFEAIGDNTYEIIKTFNFPGGDYYGGYSDAGDVDGDSIPEIVLEARQNVFIIKSAGNDSFYVWDTLPGHASGSCVRIFDIDGNGLAEIIISGNNETRIYEYDPGGIEETTLRLTPDALRLLQVYPNPARGNLRIRFNLSDEQKVTIKLYDVTGRLINEIFNGKAKIGINEMPIRAENYAAGIYFIRIETGKEIITEKFIMLK